MVEGRDLHHLGRLGRLVGPRHAAWTREVEGRHAVSLRRPGAVPGAQPLRGAGYVSKVLHSHVSLLKFCETNFGLPSLNARTKAADAMEDCFDLAQKPLPAPQ